VHVQSVGESYGHPNPKPSKFEKKLRHIFTELKSCDSFELKNKGNKGMTLSQKGKHAAKVSENKDDKSENEFMRFRMVKHPDQKKYMHYALANSEG